MAAAKKKPRRRLDAEQARELILDAAEKKLALVGPSGIRLQEVAAEAGLSHPTLLHHFGSREQLVKAVIARSIRAIDTSLIEAISSSEGKGGELASILENVAGVLEKTGHSRVIFWLVLEGLRPDTSDSKMSQVVDAAHALRLRRKEHVKKPKREDTGRLVVLAALALAAGGLLAPMLLENAGLDRDLSRFRGWLARLLVEHLDGPGV